MVTEDIRFVFAPSKCLWSDHQFKKSQSVLTILFLIHGRDQRDWPIVFDAVHVKHVWSEIMGG